MPREMKKNTALAGFLVVSLALTGSALADLPTDPGIDTYPNTSAAFTVQFLEEVSPDVYEWGGDETFNLHGPTVISRDGVQGTNDYINTQITSMPLTDGTVTLDVSATWDSVGRIRDLGGAGFESFFDVFFELSVPGLTNPVFNVDPVYMYSTFNMIPPPPVTQYFGFGWRNGEGEHPDSGIPYAGYYEWPEYPGNDPDFGFFNLEDLEPWEHAWGTAPLMLYSNMGTTEDPMIVAVARMTVHPTHQIPAPGAALLGAMGLGLVGWVRRRFG